MKRAPHWSRSDQSSPKRPRDNARDGANEGLGRTIGTSSLPSTAASSSPSGPLPIPATVSLSSTSTSDLLASLLGSINSQNNHALHPYQGQAAVGPTYNLTEQLALAAVMAGRARTRETTPPLPEWGRPVLPPSDFLSEALLQDIARRTAVSSAIGQVLRHQADNELLNAIRNANGPFLDLASSWRPTSFIPQQQDAVANMVSSLRPSLIPHDLCAAGFCRSYPVAAEHLPVPQLVTAEMKKPALAPTDSSSASSHEEATPRTSSNDQTTGRRVPVAIPSDPYVLSDYQCFLREHIVFVEADHTDVEVSARGRNVPIQLGQVGILCRHCAHLAQCNRPRGSAYFPAQLLGLYPAAQNMMVNHFAESCANIPPNDKAKLLKLKEQNKKASRGSGKEYWAKAATVVGVQQTDSGGLFFSPVASKAS